jgi:hypothetical protein
VSGKPQFGIPKRTSKIAVQSWRAEREIFSSSRNVFLEIAHLLAIIVLRKINMHAPREPETEKSEECQIAEENSLGFCCFFFDEFRRASMEQNGNI